jgi:hypothetical protein
MSEPGAQGQKPELNGTILAANMIEQLTLLNVRLGELIAISGELHSLMDTLCGHFDVVHRAMELSTELEGKVKITIVDFAKKWVDAADEILPEDEEPDDGDVLNRR